MSVKAKLCMDCIGAATWDVHNASAVLRGVVAGKTPAKNPRKAVLEYIGSAKAALEEARKAALSLPEKGGDL